MRGRNRYTRSAPTRQGPRKRGPPGRLPRFFALLQRLPLRPLLERCRRWLLPTSSFFSGKKTWGLRTGESHTQCLYLARATDPAGPSPRPGISSAQARAQITQVFNMSGPAVDRHDLQGPRFDITVAPGPLARRTRASKKMMIFMAAQRRLHC